MYPAIHEKQKEVHLHKHAQYQGKHHLAYTRPSRHTFPNKARALMLGNEAQTLPRYIGVATLLCYVYKYKVPRNNNKGEQRRQNHPYLTHVCRKRSRQGC